MPKGFGCLALLFLISLGSLSPDASAARQTSGQDQALLQEALKKTGAYCERLKAVALNFVCHENIHESNYFYKRKQSYTRSEVSGEMLYTTQLELRNVKDKTYVYDYQMVRKGEEREEQRTLLRENNRKRNKANAKLELQRYFAQYLVYGPVGFLSFYWQNHFNYRLLGTESLDGRSALKIGASPSEEREENYSFGTIWVDAADFSVLKIEWDPRSLAGFNQEVDSSIGNLKREISWNVTYGVEKNGIRFPSLQNLEETLLSHTGKRFPKYRVAITYDDFRFFIVETEIKYQDNTCGI